MHALQISVSSECQKHSSLFQALVQVTSATVYFGVFVGCVCCRPIGFGIYVIQQMVWGCIGVSRGIVFIHRYHTKSMTSLEWVPREVRHSLRVPYLAPAGNRGFRRRGRAEARFPLQKPFQGIAYTSPYRLYALQLVKPLKASCGRPFLIPTVDALRCNR